MPSRDLAIIDIPCARAPAADRAVSSTMMYPSCPRLFSCEWLVWRRSGKGCVEERAAEIDPSSWSAPSRRGSSSHYPHSVGRLLAPSADAVHETWLDLDLRCALKAFGARATDSLRWSTVVVCKMSATSFIFSRCSRVFAMEFGFEAVDGALIESRGCRRREGEREGGEKLRPVNERKTPLSVEDHAIIKNSQRPHHAL